MLFSQVLKFVVIEIATKSNGSENENRPIIHAGSATIRTRSRH